MFSDSQIYFPQFLEILIVQEVQENVSSRMTQTHNIRENINP
jgi:hypothetical protein